MASSKPKDNKSTPARSKDASASAAPSVESGKAVAKAAAKKTPSKKGDAKKGSKPGVLTRIKNYFKAVRSELKRVVWPTKPDMIKYTGAVVGMLIFFGILIALVDAVIVPVLYAFSGLR